jgi:SAM-dependent methyltransferase
MLEKAGEKDAYRDLRRMVLGEPLGFAGDSFSAAVSVGVFTTNHAPPEALDELVRVVQPDGWVIFSVRDDVYRDAGFEEKQASLVNDGRWRQGNDERSVPTLPSGKHGAPEPPLRLQDGVTPQAAAPVLPEGRCRNGRREALVPAQMPGGRRGLKSNHVSVPAFLRAHPRQAGRRRGVILLYEGTCRKTVLASGAGGSWPLDYRGRQSAGHESGKEALGTLGPSA